MENVPESPLQELRHANEHNDLLVKELAEKNLVLQQQTENLRIAHAELSQLLAHSPAVIYNLKFDGEKIVPSVLSNNIEQCLGYSIAEASINNWWQDNLHPEDRARVEDGFARGMTEGSYTQEYRFRCKDGSYRWVEDNSRVIKDASGRPREAVGVWTNITERKQADEALRESELRFRGTFEQAAVGIAHVSREGHFLLVNDKLCEIVGYPREELLGMNFADLTLPENLEESLQQLESSLRGDQHTFTMEKQYRRKCGAMVWVNLVSTLERNALGEPKYFIAVFEDITSRKRAERALQASEANMATAQRIAHFGSWELDLRDGEDINTQPLTWSDEMFRIAGFEPGSVEVSNELFFSLVPAEEHAAITKAMAAATQQREQYAIVHRLIRPNGEERTIYERAQLVFHDRTGAPLKIVGTAQDITERVNSEETLRLLGSAIEQSKESIMITCAQLDLPGPAILFVNPAFTRMTGYTAEEVIGKTPRILQGPRTDRNVMTRLRKNLEAGEGFAGEAINYRKDGTAFNLEWQVAPIRTPAGKVTHFVAIQRDITERQRNEKMALRSQRLESLGTLAGGVAHDLNNALAPILMGVGLLNVRYPEETSLVEMMEASAKRGAEMVRQLLSFARGAEGERVSIDLTHVMTELESMMRGSFPKNINFEVRWDAKLPTVLGDATQLHQVLLNLCVNARDAMPLGGTLLLKAEREEVDAAYASQIPDGFPGNFVLLKVSDTGLGIAPEILDRIFDPFFTTKGPEKGTGLGLSTVSGIVKGHGGFIHAYSQRGQGSTFSVYLPAELAGVEAVIRSGKPAEYRGAGEMILVVDDEPAIRKMSGAVLKRLNLNPITASDGLEALMLAAENRSSLKAVITDLHMPHMDGLNFVQALRRMLPDIPIVVASGLMEEAMASKFEALGVTNRLDKPFTEAQLGNVLLTLLPSKREAEPEPEASHLLPPSALSSWWN